MPVKVRPSTVIMRTFSRVKVSLVHIFVGVVGCELTVHVVVE